MIDKKTVYYVAALARLRIEDAEAERFARNLDDILQYIDKLNKLDVDGVRPTSHVLAVENVYRDDKVLPSLSPEEAFSFAVEQHERHYKVPKVIE
ncbi:MAG: Asp-tRNA(Asn)/Glu-tRNA(Gln) amidotransferase subunit GatC [Candidatus Omnitrophica bacterium]|nr:Asp-tRNA(Asn)/Glu-tRNA(Gln) amidotransferase subunit GatC [Candidatus Omnitrophota bacterium]